MARARSRRTNRRSASQRAASLLALALPAPLQRVADTRLGPMLMLVAIPTMIVAGLLNINWNNGAPSLSIDQQRASEIRNAAREQITNFESQGGLQQLGQAATNLLNRTEGFSNGVLANQSYGTAAYGAHQPNQPSGYTQSQLQTQSRANFPSTQPQAANAQTNWHQSTAQPSTHATQPAFAPQTYSQQPAYSQSGYSQQAASPSDARSLAYQQQLYQQQQQQLYQQQLYEQQLKQYQYQQWLAQQPAATGYPQTDAYGRPVTTGYAQPAGNYSQPSSQYGQQNNNQGALPSSANSRGRY